MIVITRSDLENDTAETEGTDWFDEVFVEVATRQEVAAYCKYHCHIGPIRGKDLRHKDRSWTTSHSHEYFRIKRRASILPTSSTCRPRQHRESFTDHSKTLRGTQLCSSAFTMPTCEANAEKQRLVIAPKFTDGREVPDNHRNIPTR